MVGRLRVQQRIKIRKEVDESRVDENEMPEIPSYIPFLPHELELKLGLGGTSYKDFIRNMQLPMQLSHVDPIVASFSGGAVGVISALMLLEINNVDRQEKLSCKYCHGTEYLACARCSASGLCLSTEPILTSASNVPLCAPTMMASEHDPRIEPFD